MFMITLSCRGFFFVLLGVCAKLYLAVFCEIDSGLCHKCPRWYFAEHSAVDRERVEPKKSVFPHAGDNSVQEFLERERVPCTADPFLHKFYLPFNFWNVLIGCGRIEGKALAS